MFAVLHLDLRFVHSYIFAIQMFAALNLDKVVDDGAESSMDCIY
jgi:hypothetical protein